MGLRSLSLFFGPQVPVPAPLEISEALERVEIESAIGERGTFRLTFRADFHAAQEALLPESGHLTRVSLVLREGSHASVVMEGVAVVYTLASGPDGKTSLVVSGEDLTRVMDLVVGEQSFPGTPPHVRVQVLLAKYTAFGVIPLVIPLGPTVPIPTDPIQHATDYAYIRALAEIAEFRFTLDPGPVPGSSIAYWGPEPRPIVPEPALTIDFGRSPVETVQLSFDASALLVTPAQPARAVTGGGTLDVERAGVRLRPGAGVDVRGAGKPFDGLFHVNRVCHTITRDTQTQAFELVRAGGGS